MWDFPGGSVVKNPPCNAQDSGSVPGWGNKILLAAAKTWHSQINIFKIFFKKVSKM